MVRGHGLSKAVANDRTMIKSKPSLPANNMNLSSDNTLDYVGFWQQKALLHFTNSAYKGTTAMNSNVCFVQYQSAQLTSYLHKLLALLCLVRHNFRAQICLCQYPNHSGSVGV
jgi:hypothetical protein